MSFVGQYWLDFCSAIGLPFKTSLSQITLTLALPTEWIAFSSLLAPIKHKSFKVHNNSFQANQVLEMENSVVLPKPLF